MRKQVLPPSPLPPKQNKNKTKSVALPTVKSKIVRWNLKVHNYPDSRKPFYISREPRTSRSHVNCALPSGLRSGGNWCTARFFYTLKHHNPIIIPKWHTARKHVIGKSEILNIILSCGRVFIAVQNWMARSSRTSGLIRLRTRTFETKNCQAVSADAVFSFLNIFVENERTNAE